VTNVESDVLRRRVLDSLPFILLAAICVSYFAYVWMYGVNVPYWDEWELAATFKLFFYGQLSLGNLITATQRTPGFRIFLVDAVAAFDHEFQYQVVAVYRCHTPVVIVADTCKPRMVISG
jgi:hypothetical protein